MKKTINITRCDRCGKRIYEGKYYIIESRWNLSNETHKYDICVDCARKFWKELEYNIRIKPNWDIISDEELIKD